MFFRRKSRYPPPVPVVFPKYDVQVPEVECVECEVCLKKSLQELEGNHYFNINARKQMMTITSAASSKVLFRTIGNAGRVGRLTPLPEEECIIKLQDLYHPFSDRPPWKYKLDFNHGMHNIVHPPNPYDSGHGGVVNLQAGPGGPQGPLGC